MYRKIDDFFKDWEYESEATLKMFGNLNDRSLTFKPSEDIRSIGFLAWHITTTISEMLNRTGLELPKVLDENQEPDKATLIYEEYKAAAESVKQELKSKWTDETLKETINMYGETWTKGTVLSVLVLHQTHHRGQLTILMRLAGLKVPGIYGPSKEEWSVMNMPAMK